MGLPRRLCFGWNIDNNIRIQYIDRKDRGRRISFFSFDMARMLVWFEVGFCLKPDELENIAIHGLHAVLQNQRFYSSSTKAACFVLRENTSHK
jgi:hypothetical protein